MRKSRVCAHPLRPNWLISLYFPAKQGMRVQRRVRRRLPAPPASLLLLQRNSPVLNYGLVSARWGHEIWRKAPWRAGFGRQARLHSSSASLLQEIRGLAPRGQEWFQPARTTGSRSRRRSMQTRAVHCLTISARFCGPRPSKTVRDRRAARDQAFDAAWNAARLKCCKRAQVHPNVIESRSRPNAFMVTASSSA